MVLQIQEKSNIVPFIMKVVKIPGDEANEKQSFTLRLRKETLKKLDKIAQKNDLSRQKLLEALLEQVLRDKSFTLEMVEV